MLKNVIIIAVLLFLHIYSYEILYDPTVDEIKQGIAVFPSKSWGFSLRKEKSARILALGNVTLCHALDHCETKQFYYFLKVEAILQLAIMLKPLMHI